MSKPICLDEIIDAMEMDDDELLCVLDRQTGEVIVVSRGDRIVREEDLLDEEPLEAAMQADEIPEEILPHLVEWGMGDRFLSLPSRFDIHEWDIMRRFALSLEDEGACDRLMNDLRGRGAFGRFKNRVHKLGLADQWYAYRDAALRQIAIDWCEEHDLRWYERNPPASQQPCDDPPSGQVP